MLAPLHLRSPLVGALCLLSMSLLGCGATLHANVQDGIFRHEMFGYEVRSRFRGDFVPITADWKVDNLRGTHGRLRSKKGPDYEAEYFLDSNDDGKAESLGKFFLLRPAPGEHAQRRRGVAANDPDPSRRPRA